MKRLIKYKSIGNMNFKKSDFGKIAFLSLEEAESALAEMKG